MVLDGLTEAEQVRYAQRTLDVHTTSSATGLCLECRQRGPCPEREVAVRIFSRASRLPQRTPMATQPGLIGARKVC